MTSKPTLPSEDAMEAAILSLVSQPGAPRTIDPAQAAQALAGEAKWQHLMPLVRRAAVRLANAGQLTIYRKGKPIDPAEFRGVYRLGLPPAAEV